MKFLDQFSVKKLHDDLDYWIMLKMDADIYTYRSQRLEYQHYVKEAELKSVPDISLYVLLKLQEELKKPFYLRKTFWILVKLFFFRKLNII